MIKRTNNTTKYKDDFSVVCADIISGTISIFLLILVTVFPLILHESYVDILKTKYQCYYITIIGMLIAVLFLAIIMLLIDLKEYHGRHAVYLFAKLHPHNWRTTFCTADAAVSLFWLVSLISTLHSNYLYESFWGNEGRYSGFFLLTLYVISYFIISRFWKVKGWCWKYFYLQA